jgi:hypothetical protein
LKYNNISPCGFLVTLQYEDTANLHKLIRKSRTVLLLGGEKMPKFEREVEIDAPVEKVWEALTNPKRILNGFRE